MKSKKVIVFSGHDRVGKSTVIKRLEQMSLSSYIKHHSAPPDNSQYIMEQMWNTVSQFSSEASYEEILLIDRGWACTHIYQIMRDNSFGLIKEILELEANILTKLDIEVIHVLVKSPWNWASRNHLEELTGMKDANWLEIDKLETRRREHKQYYELFEEFQNEITMFPTYTLESPQINSFEKLSKLIREINDYFAY